MVGADDIDESDAHGMPERFAVRRRDFERREVAMLFEQLQVIGIIIDGRTIAQMQLGCKTSGPAVEASRCMSRSIRLRRRRTEARESP